MSTLRFSFALLLALCTTASQASEAIDRAKKVFESYVSGYHAYDPQVVELYADTALIYNKRTYPDGQVREITIPARQYKTIIKNAMPLAQSIGERSQYQSPQFSEEGVSVRVTLMRYSERKKFTSPMSLVIGPVQDGRWLVLEEKTESIP